MKNSASREGYTTDPDGFLKSLEEAKITLSGKVVILGCGGVARTFGYESALAGCDITFVTREQSLVKGQNLAVEVTEKISGSKVSACTVAELEKTELERLRAENKSRSISIALICTGAVLLLTAISWLAVGLIGA